MAVVLFSLSTIIISMIYLKCVCEVTGMNPRIGLHLFVRVEQRVGFQVKYDKLSQAYEKRKYTFLSLRSRKIRSLDLQLPIA